jgi:hypothetical protein
MACAWSASRSDHLWKKLHTANGTMLLSKKLPAGKVPLVMTSMSSDR